MCAGEVAVQLLHLFVEVSTAAVAQTAGPGASSNGALSPILKNTPAASAALATQVAAARVLGRVVVASAYCRTAVIAVARDRQLLVRLLPALRCHLTIEEVEVRKDFRIVMMTLDQSSCSFSFPSCCFRGARSRFPTW